MKLKCWKCGHEFEGSISNDQLGWHSYCEECDGSFDVDIEDYLVRHKMDSVTDLIGALEV